VTVALVGHRAAGKSTVLPEVARRLSRIGIDLDLEIERRYARSIRRWVAEDEVGFRRAEREAFLSLPPNLVVAVGGGFLFHHADVLRDVVAVLVPVTFETFRERLLADSTRPRLKPRLSLEEELLALWEEREAHHRLASPMTWVDFELALKRPLRARRVVTLPPSTEVAGFSVSARAMGAEVLEVRTDLTASTQSLEHSVLPLLVAERGFPIPDEWRAQASLVDEVAGALVSRHEASPLSPDQVLELWSDVPTHAHIKHVEPLGSLTTASRLLATQEKLIERFGPHRVTVLAVGPLALPFRAVLAERNALDYLALGASWSAAPGQRLLSDAVRTSRRGQRDGMTARLGLLGHDVSHSRSPRVHVQPFDRIDLPADADVGALLRALWPSYRGFAVTNPFKKGVATAVGAHRDAVNTLVRTRDGYEAFNTDREGAAAVLAVLFERTQRREVAVLGDGGATDALKEAAQQMGLTVEVMTRSKISGALSQRAAVWTWPAFLEPPASLRLDGVVVAVIAYGAPARVVAEHIRARGGTPLRLGPRWFIAQARRQRELWESAT
jgi:shikimate kinase